VHWAPDLTQRRWREGCEGRGACGEQAAEDEDARDGGLPHGHLGCSERVAGVCGRIVGLPVRVLEGLSFLFTEPTSGLSSTALLILPR
jgi:hypothetical protein